MCIGLLKPEEWKPSSKISTVLEFARQLLREPMVDDAVEPRIAEVYRERRREWEKKAKEWTGKYGREEVGAEPVK
jgi:ubiquitin-protein ligase